MPQNWGIIWGKTVAAQPLQTVAAARSSKTFPGRGPGSSFRGQAENRSGAISLRAGRSTRQRSKAKGQRGGKWQPGGGRSGGGVSPLSAENFFFFASSRGTSSRSACV